MISIPLKNGGLLLLVKLIQPIASNGFQTRPDIQYDGSVLANNDFTLETWDEADGYAEQTGNQKSILTYSPYLLDDSTDCSTVCIRLTLSETNHTIAMVTAKDVVTGSKPWLDNCFPVYFNDAQTQLAELNAANLPTDVSNIAGQITALNDFDPAVDVVANVTLVDTVTTNTDMVSEPDNATISAIAGYLDTEVQAITDAIAAIQADIDNGTSGLVALQTLLDTINTKAIAIKNFTAAKM